MRSFLGCMRREHPPRRRDNERSMEWRKWYRHRKGVVDTKSTVGDIVCTSTTFPFLPFPPISLPNPSDHLVDAWSDDV